MSRRILVVDDEPLKRATLQLELGEHGYEMFEAADAATAWRIVDSTPLDLVVAEVDLPDWPGLELLTRIRRARPETAVILMSAYGKIDDAVLAIKRGAYDYITKPFATRDLLVKVAALFAQHAPVSGGDDTMSFGELVTRSPSMKQVLALARRAAQTVEPVLITGETGSGKSALAKAIHQHGPRSTKALVVCQCAGATPADVERLLFGPADQRTARPKSSLMEQARGGTLVLDNLDAVSEQLQAALLRQAETPPGQRDARLIATTRRNLRALADSGDFDAALYHRVACVRLDMPPLRERPSDAALIAVRMLEAQPITRGTAPVAFSPAACEQLTRESWPGNVRELEHVIQRAAALCGGGEIRPEHIQPASPIDHRAERLLAGEFLGNAQPALNEVLADVEQRMILMALQHCNGNQARAAERLGIPRTTLRDKIAKYNLST